MNLKYQYNLDVFFKQNDLSYYLLGAFITDGCVYKNGKNTHACQLSSCDVGWLDEIKNIIGTNLKLHKFKENYYGIRIIRTEIANWFITNGCTPKKTYSIKLPNIPKQYFRDFIRGCLDGDGSIGEYKYKNNIKRSCQLISASKYFLKSIKKELFKYSIKTTITNRGKQNSIINNKKIKATTNSYSLNAYGTNCFKLLNFAYYAGHKISLQRKKNIAESIINYYTNKSCLDLRKIPRYNKGCKITWPTDNELIQLIKKSNCSKVSRTLGVHVTAVINRLKRRNLYPIKN